MTSVFVACPSLASRPAIRTGALVLQARWAECMHALQCSGRGWASHAVRAHPRRARTPLFPCLLGVAGAGAMPRRGRHLRAPCVSAAAAAAAAAALLVCLAGACDLARAVAGEAAAAAAAGECADAEAASDAAAVWSRVDAALSSAAATSPRGENIARVSGARLLSAAGEPSGRPYHLVLFLSSEGQLTQAQAKLVRLARQQFALVASSYKAQSALAGGREAGQHNSARGDSEAATAARAALGGARLHFLELMFEDAPEVFSVRARRETTRGGGRGAVWRGRSQAASAPRCPALSLPARDRFHTKLPHWLTPSCVGAICRMTSSGAASEERPVRSAHRPN